jgi:outer membrane protein assembly factor BamA
MAEEANVTAERSSGLTFFPIIMYTPETRFGGGFGSVYTFYITENRPSSIQQILIYTQNKQYTISLRPEVYLKDETYRLSVGIAYQKFPSSFYGIGNDTSNDMEEDYTSQMATIGVNAQRKIFSGLSMGVQYEFAKDDVSDTEPGGLLAGGQILGSEGGIVSGIGFLINWDNRNNILYPTGGSLYQISSLFYQEALNSDYEFASHSLDLLQYFSINPSQTIALHGFLSVVEGDPPFQKLSLLGGSSSVAPNIMRGYYQGRYRDKNMIAFQAEYRIVPIWKRFGLVGFLGIGDVSDTMSNFELDGFKYAAGIGLRFQLNPEEMINLRIDTAFGKDSSGSYIQILEAF